MASHEAYLQTGDGNHGGLWRLRTENLVNQTNFRQKVRAVRAGAWRFASHNQGHSRAAR